MNKLCIALALLVSPAVVFAHPLPGETTAGVLPFLLKVGSDAACDYTTIFDAMNAAGSLQNVVVRVAKNVAPQNANFTAREQLTIEGGYDTCSDTTASGRTTVNGSGAAGSVLYISNGYNNGTDYQVFLRNLKISGGVGASSPARGGGLNIQGPLHVYLDNTTVRDNSTPSKGGGIYIKGQPGNAGTSERTELIVYGNSEVNFNDAQMGGGIACEEKVSVRIFDAKISNNEVSLAGGGISSVGCHVSVFEDRLGAAQGITFNQAIATTGSSTTLGGGIYSDSGTVVLRGGLSGPARIFGNNADFGGGIYSRNSSKLFAYDSDISNNTAVTGGGVYAESTTTVIARTKAGASCYDEIRCSTLSDNWATAPGVTTSGGGGAVYAIAGTTRITGTFIENNQALGGRGMAVRVIDAPGTNTGFDQNGLRILGSVLAKNTNGSSVIVSYGSIVEFKDSSGAVGFSTFTGNRRVTNIIYTPSALSTSYGIDVYGSIFDSTSTNAAGPGGNGTIPNGDCNRLHENTSAFAMNSERSNMYNPQFVNAGNGDYRLGGINLVDWCDASYNNLAGSLSADGGARPYDDPNIAAEFGNYDLGGLERHPTDLIFRDGLD